MIVENKKPYDFIRGEDKKNCQVHLKMDLAILSFNAFSF